jgi:thiamine-phosphate pyrophosphorylase
VAAEQAARSPAGDQRLCWPAVVLITDTTSLRGRALAGIVGAAVDGGVSIVQLRDKAASHDALVRDGRAVRAAIGGRALFFVNSDVEAAIALGADGVHLPDDCASLASVRARVGASMMISRAVHTIDAAIAAQRDGADVVQAGTLFETPSKPGAAVLELDGLRAICEVVHIPVIAIGGVTALNAAAAIDAGAAGVAVIGAILDADDPCAAATALVAAVSKAAADAGRAPAVVRRP